MKQKFSFSIIFGIWGFIISLPIAFLLGGLWAGILWLTVVGDTDPYNLSYLFEIIPAIIGVFSVFGITLTSTYLGFKYGKENENKYTTRKINVILLISLLVIVVLAIFASAHFYQRLHPEEIKCMEDSDCVHESYHQCVNKEYFNPDYSLNCDEDDPNRPEECDLPCKCIKNECKILR